MNVNEIYRIELPKEAELSGLQTNQSQLISIENLSKLHLKMGQKVELQRRMDNSSFIYPVVVTKIEKTSENILVETIYDLSLYEISETPSREALARRVDWPFGKYIVVSKNNGRNVFYTTTKKDEAWKSEDGDFSSKNWGFIYYAV